MITHVKVKNFKSLRDVSLPLGLRNVLVGPNMTGKSNFLDVFRFLMQMVLPLPGEYGLQKAINSMGGPAEVTWKGGESSVFSISLKGTAPFIPSSQTQATWEYEISILGGGTVPSTVQRESLQISHGGSLHELVGTEDGNRVFRGLDGKTVTHVGDRQRSVLEFEIPAWEGNVFRRYVSNMRFYFLNPKAMKQLNPAVAPNFLIEDGQNLSNWLMILQTRYRDAFASVRNAAKDVFPDLDDLFTWPTQQATVFLASKEKHLKRPTSLFHMSDGELAFIAFLSLIFCPIELGASLYCIEEPENHLHVRLLATLVKLLKQVQDGLGPEHAAQCFITTHSPHLVDMCDVEELIVFDKRDGETRCVRPSDKSHIRELLASRATGLGELHYMGLLGDE